MWEYTYCSFTCGWKWNMQVHEKRKHLKQDVDTQQDVYSMEQLAQDYRNLKQNYDKILHENRLLVNDGQQRLRHEYYQNIKNQFDQAKNSNIQWSEAYIKLHESGLKLEGNLNEEEA